MLRAIAAMFVVIHHVLEESLPLFVNGGLPRALVLVGACGVDLFFVISGFIMLHTTWDYFGQTGGVSRFLRKRFFRIFPLYWICILILLLAKSIGLYRNTDFTFINVMSSSSLMPFFQEGTLLHGVAWTLVFEMYFYYIFAAWIKVPKPWHAAIGICLSLAVLMFIGGALSPDATIRIANPIVLEFCFGLGIALLFRYHQAVLDFKWLLFLLALVWLPIGTYLAPGVETGGLDGYVRILIWGIPSALIVCSVLNIKNASGSIEKFLVYLGNASYSLYLFHPFVMTAYAKLIKSAFVTQMMAPFYMLFATALSVLLGIMVHEFIEKPLLKFSQKI